MKYVNKQKMFIFSALDKRGSFHAAKVSIFTRMCNFFPRFIFSYCRRGGSHGIEQPCRPPRCCCRRPLLLLLARCCCCRRPLLLLLARCQGRSMSPLPWRRVLAPSLSSHRRRVLASSLSSHRRRVLAPSLSSHRLLAIAAAMSLRAWHWSRLIVC